MWGLVFISVCELTDLDLCDSRFESFLFIYSVGRRFWHLTLLSRSHMSCPMSLLLDAWCDWRSNRLLVIVLRLCLRLEHVENRQSLVLLLYESTDWAERSHFFFAFREESLFELLLLGYHIFVRWDAWRQASLWNGGNPEINQVIHIAHFCQLDLALMDHETDQVEYLLHFVEQLSRVLLLLAHN